VEKRFVSPPPLKSSPASIKINDRDKGHRLLSLFTSFITAALPAESGEKSPFLTDDFHIPDPLDGPCLFRIPGFQIMHPKAFLKADLSGGGTSPTSLFCTFFLPLWSFLSITPLIPSEWMGLAEEMTISSL